MSTRHVTLKVEADSAREPIFTIKSESLRLLPDQNRFPDETVVTPMPAPIIRNSKFVGFERGRRRLQPFVGPKEF
jgi:hypothetical protein